MKHRYVLRRQANIMGVIWALALPLTSAASPSSGQDAQAGPAQFKVQAESSAMTDGEVRKIDLAQGKVTLRHAEMKHLDMPPMTMVFLVKDKGLLTTIKAGDKVKFRAINDGGKFTVTDIQTVP
jgi:Cu(I)/Ag(I) efflux system periplasmic protein CusF